MSKRDAKLLARHWVDEPNDLAQDLTSLISWIEDNGLSIPADAAARQRGALMASATQADEVLQRIKPIELSLLEYRRQMPRTRLDIELLRPINAAFTEAAANLTDVLFENFAAIKNELLSLQRWAHSETRKTSSAPNRSELLKTTIEELEDEIIVRTDSNGSLKLRGSMSIPMFLALWKAPKHRLDPETFLDIDRRSNPKNMDRHRARLCSSLQKVLIEVVADESGVRMQKCK